MTKVLIVVVASWVAAVAAIVFLFATDRIAWPEFWLLGFTFVAAVTASCFAPRHRWWWIAASPLTAFGTAAVASLIVFSFLTHYSQVAAESWLMEQFNGAPPVPPDEILCTGVTNKCSLGEIANRHGGAANVDCYDNIPLEILGWECRAEFRDGTSITFDAWATWARRSAYVGEEAP